MEESSVTKSSDEVEKCSYLLRCTLSRGGDAGFSCGGDRQRTALLVSVSIFFVYLKSSFVKHHEMFVTLKRMNRLIDVENGIRVFPSLESPIVSIEERKIEKSWAQVRGDRFRRSSEE
jgi:hypothetical protein